MAAVSLAPDPAVAHNGRPLQVLEALHAMAEAVRSGDMMKARGIGEQCVVPLNLTAAELAMSGRLSAGAESTVFRGRWRGRDVAVKKVRIAVSADLDRFRRELDLLSSLNHPAVIPVLGARALPPDYMIVLPLAVGGNIRHALYDEGWRPNWRQLLGLACSVAAGMEHVHATGILHRDLKPANLLMLDPLPHQHQQPGQMLQKGLNGNHRNAGIPGTTAEVVMKDFAVAPDSRFGSISGLLTGGIKPLRVQIADFGIAVRAEWLSSGGGDAVSGLLAQEASAHAVAKGGKPSGGFYKRMMVGTLEYMAPELLLRTAPASRASDVYAWAVTMNELATGVVPFSDCTKENPEVHTVLEMGYGRMELAAAVCAEGLRPLLPHSCPPGFAALMQSCWKANPAERPTFSQVLLALEQLAEEVAHWEQQQQPRFSIASKKLVVTATAVYGAESIGGGDRDDAIATATMDVCAENHNNCAAEPAITSPEPLSSSAAAVVVAAAGASHIQPPFVLCSDECDSVVNSHADGIRHSVSDCSLAAALQKESVPFGEAAAATREMTVGRIFNAAMFEAIGPRDSMEDRCVLLPEVPAVSACAGVSAASVEGSTVRLPLVALFDGHRGAQAAEFCRTRLAETFWAEAQRCASPAEALRRTFVRLETEYHALWQKQKQRHHGVGPVSYPGTTALAVLLAPGGRLVVANAGDCRAVVCRGRCAMAASRDHTGLLEDERQRLTACGTAVTWQHGGWRIGSSGLQVTRCIGDFDVKASGASTSSATGVTATPEITSLQLQSDDHFIVLGTDGLWDVVSAQEAVGLVYDTVKDPTLAAKRLATEALMRGSTDNVSVVVVFLSRVTTIERVYGTAEGEAFAITGTVYGSRVRLTRDRHIMASADEMRDTY